MYADISCVDAKRIIEQGGSWWMFAPQPSTPVLHYLSR